MQRNERFFQCRWKHEFLCRTICDETQLILAAGGRRLRTGLPRPPRHEHPSLLARSIEIVQIADNRIRTHRLIAFSVRFPSKRAASADCWMSCSLQPVAAVHRGGPVNFSPRPSLRSTWVRNELFGFSKSLARSPILKAPRTSNRSTFPKLSNTARWIEIYGYEAAERRTTTSRLVKFKVAKCNLE